MKGIKRLVSIFASALVATVVMLVTPATLMAGVINMSVDVDIPFVANGNDVVVLNSDEGQQTLTLSSSRVDKVEDSFQLSFDEPGDYSFTITDSSAVYEGIVQIYNENDGLASSVFVYNSEGVKMDELDFFNPYSVNIIVDVIGNGSVSGSGLYSHGSQVTVTAIPDEGSNFIGWKDADGNIVSTDLTYTFWADASLYDEYQLFAVFEAVETTVPLTGETVSIIGSIGVAFIAAAIYMIQKYIIRKFKMKGENDEA